MIVILALLTILNEAALWGMMMPMTLSKVMLSMKRILLRLDAHRTNTAIQQNQCWLGGKLTPAMVFKYVMKPEKSKQQKSPPAWTQETYRPLLIKYSICWPIGGGEVPHPLDRGYPLPGWENPVPGWGYPTSGWGGTPSLAEVPTIGTWAGYPPDLAGVPPTDLTMVPPSGPDQGIPLSGPGWGTFPFWPWSGYPYPSPVWTNKQTETITFPHPSDAGGNKSIINFHEIYPHFKVNFSFY